MCSNKRGQSMKSPVAGTSLGAGFSSAEIISMFTYSPKSVTSDILSDAAPSSLKISSSFILWFGLFVVLCVLLPSVWSSERATTWVTAKVMFVFGDPGAWCLFSCQLNSTSAVALNTCLINVMLQTLCHILYVQWFVGPARHWNTSLWNVRPLHTTRLCHIYYSC